jgi:hypothetical protein
MVGAAVPRALGLLLAVAATSSCASDTNTDETGSGTTPGSTGFESQGWRGSRDYGDSASPWVVNASIHGTSTTDLFVAGYVFGVGGGELGFVDHLVGDHWESVYESYLSLWGVWAASPSLAFAVGRDRIVRLDGAETTVHDVSDPEAFDDGVLRGVWGWGHDDVLAVGRGGRILHYDGEQWVTEASGTGTELKAVWGSAPDNVFVVGDGGTILNRSGDAWALMESGTSVDLNGVWGSGPNDVYAVGGSELDPGHVILHYDGSGWSTVHMGDTRRSTLIGVSGRSASDICAVGAFRDADDTPHALIFPFDGSAWQEVAVDAEVFLWDIWPAGAGAYIVVGPDDTLATVRY